jgi:hypothetical protein
MMYPGQVTGQASIYNRPPGNSGKVKKADFTIGGPSKNQMEIGSLGGFIHE